MREQSWHELDVDDHSDELDQGLRDDHDAGEGVLVGQSERERQHDERVARRSAEYQCATVGRVQSEQPGGRAPDERHDDQVGDVNWDDLGNPPLVIFEKRDLRGDNDDQRQRQ